MVLPSVYLEQRRPVSKRALVTGAPIVPDIAVAAMASTHSNGLEKAMITLTGEDQVAEMDPAIQYNSLMAGFSLTGLSQLGIADTIAAGALLLLSAGLLFLKFKGRKKAGDPPERAENNNNNDGRVSSSKDWGTPYIIEAKDLTYIYRSGSTKALDGINFNVRPGERIVLLGANGAGKSTLFKHLNGILKPTSGQVCIKGRPIDRSNIKEVRRTVGVVFQDPDDQIFSPTVAQDVAFGPMNLGLPASEVERRVEWALDMVQLTGYEDRAPHHLSGGEKKRVAIAGILAMKPEVMVLDEPTNGLDPGAASRLMQLIMEMNQQLGITMIIATHEVDLVPEFAQRICVLSAGQIIGDGTPAEIFSQPDLISHTHLRLPLVAQLMEQLREGKLDVEVELTVDGARDEILRAAGRQKCISR